MFLSGKNHVFELAHFEGPGVELVNSLGHSSTGDYDFPRGQRGGCCVIVNFGSGLEGLIESPG